MDNNMESVWTDLSSGHALLANNKEYPSTSELSEPPALNPISNIEDDTALLLTELSSQPALLQTPEDYNSNSTDSSEEDVPLSSYLWTKQRSPINTDKHSRQNCEDYDSDSTDSSESSEEDIPSSSYWPAKKNPIDTHEHSTSAKKDKLGIPTRPDKRELTKKQQAAAKKQQNENWSKKRSKKKFQGANEALTDLPATCGSVFRDVHVIKRDFFPYITAETKEKKKQRRAERKFFKKFGGPKPSNEPTHPCNPTAAKISCAYKIINDPKQFHLYSHGHARIFDKALTEDKNPKGLRMRWVLKGGLVEVACGPLAGKGNVALLANQQFMVEHNLPAFSDSQLPDTSNKTKLPFALILVIPTRKSGAYCGFSSRDETGVACSDEPMDLTLVAMSVKGPIRHGANPIMAASRVAGY
ncbi:hypothetical protein PSTG_01235 [Puccinia striiformis f. sp. tritici PST-78]|uniref:Uncharacterized protein n=1 Tax=Puccinia striiformis f. sp. tritici PST-78 TaxID=1165861 RepID=A0A0L0W2R7_9BASI|nr:hypothetical protein PSTG_01235 [Puccinia striiformis f. sp. tritici PST-78]